MRVDSSSEAESKSFPEVNDDRFRLRERLAAVFAQHPTERNFKANWRPAVFDFALSFQKQFDIRQKILFLTLEHFVRRWGHFVAQALES